MLTIVNTKMTQVLSLDLKKGFILSGIKILKELDPGENDIKESLVKECKLSVCMWLN